MKVLQPANWKRPRGYSNGVAAKGNTVFISGMVGWNGQEALRAPARQVSRRRRTDALPARRLIKRPDGSRGAAVTRN